MNATASTAADEDAKYQPLSSATSDLGNAITQIDPGNMTASLAKVAAAGRTISHLCSG